MSVGKQGENIYRKIDWDAMTITNNFLFQEVLRNKPICKRLLESILHIQIKDIHYPQTEKSLTAQLRSKSIRLDLYVTDKENNVYDVEMQSAGRRSVLYSELDRKTVISELPLRTRYYQSIISTNMLKKGMHYRYLRKAYVIFICTFDPFKKGLPVYHFTYRCKENPALEMGDKTENIFLNSKAADKADDIELSAFLSYINGKAATTSFTKVLDKEAERIKANDDWRYRVMTLDMEIKDMQRRHGEKVRQKTEQIINQRVATDMIKDREPLAKIIKYSKLSEATIRKLAKSMGIAVL